MNVACPECKSVFRVDPARVTSVNLRARCSICGGLIAVGASIRWGDDFPVALGEPPRVPARAPDRLPLPDAPPPRSHPSEASVAAAPVPPAEGTPPAPLPSGAAPPPASGAATAEPHPVPAPSAPQSELPPAPSAATAWSDASLGAPGDDAAAPTIDAAVPPRVPPFSPARRSAPVTPAFGAPAFPASSLRPPTPAFTPAFTPAASAAKAHSSPPPAQGPAREGGGTAEPVPAPAPVAASAPAPAPPPSAASVPAAPRRPINPFLSNDPNQKARRLARALVSDMVAYHPAKREDGNRNGTLKQLFRDEIKKSYEEYVEQVGRDFAESTTHFQDALNDVLAGGKRIF